MQKTLNYQSPLPFALAKYFAWGSLIVIVASSIVLAVFIGNTTKTTLLQRQENYLTLLAENLNNQIYRRFTMPIVLTHGRIALRDETQYERLDDVVQSIVHGLQIDNIRIYDTENIISYSTDPEELGKLAEDDAAVKKVYNKEGKSIIIFQNISFMQAFFETNIEKDSVRLRSLSPLTIVEANLNQELDDPVLGVLEITMDISEDYTTVIQFQRIIFLAFFMSSILLFIVLQKFAKYAERILTERLEQNRKLEASLHQHEKLASMGRTVASIAHEIRNPLGIICSSSELLLKRNEDMDKVSKNILVAINDEANRLRVTVNDFLDYAKPRDIKLTPRNLCEIIDNVVAFMQSEFTRLGINLTYNCQNTQVLVEADLLYRAIYNILANAVQAMHDSEQKDLSIKVSKLDKDFVQILIIDTGVGIDKEALQHIIDPFYTTKENGTGLGLSIVNTIIASHSGVLEINNNEDIGANVKITLPIYYEV